MQADKITEVAINDVLIVYFGDDLLKKHKTKRNLYHISNKLRECARFLLEIRKHGEYSDMLSTLTPDSFDKAIEATKNISRYNTDKRSFGAASLALHFGTTLKKLLLRKKITCINSDCEKTLLQLKRFRKLVESQWTTEIGSLALKKLNEKASIKPQLLPLTEDIMKLRNFVEQRSKSTYEQLNTSKTEESYKTLAEMTLIAAIIHNRKRVGDIQYLYLQAYNEQENDRSDEQGGT
nr:unnamed protein product [Callosobruchus analis]